MLIQLLIPLFASFLAVVILTPFCIKLARHFNLVDDPKKHVHPAIIHTKSIPRAGGLPIYLAIFIACLIFLPHNLTFAAILFSGFLVVLVGLLDDKYDLSPYIRFFANIVCAALVVFSGVTIPYVTSPLGGILNFSPIHIATVTISLGSLIAIGWIVWVMNMLNWSKGVDGQMPGIAAISAIIIGIASLRFAQLNILNIESASLAFITAGAALGFLVYNFYPAKIFPGYSATILGFIIGIASIISGVKLATAILVMGVPAVDFLFTFARRIISKHSPFRGDRQHLHHLLLNTGLSQRKIALFYWIMSLVLGVLSLTLSSRGKLFAIILVLVLVSGFILTLRFVLRLKPND